MSHLESILKMVFCVLLLLLFVLLLRVKKKMISCSAILTTMTLGQFSFSSFDLCFASLPYSGGSAEVEVEVEVEVDVETETETGAISSCSRLSYSYILLIEPR